MAALVWRPISGRSLGTTDIVLEPLDFIARLAALIPPPRVHLTRYHGVFAANAALRAAITPAGRGSKAPSGEAERATPKHVALNWAHRLKRVFGIEIEQCARCGGWCCALQGASPSFPEDGRFVRSSTKGT
jgi:hypothetical protein